MTINYQARNNDEHKVLIITYLAKDCLAFIVRDDIPAPKVDHTIDIDITGIETDPVRIVSLLPNEIRNVLNRILASRLQQAHNNLYTVYDAFCNEFDLPLHTAFFRANREGQRSWFDYQLKVSFTWERKFRRSVYGKKTGDDDPNSIVL